MRFVFKIVHKCSRCKKDYKIADFRSGCRILKMCIKCRERGKKLWEKWKCIHGRREDTCKECGGARICEHNRRKTECKECGGVSICEHNRIKSRCKVCGGNCICIHHKHNYSCKECGDPIDLTIKNMISGSKKKDKKIDKYDEPNFIDYSFLKNLIDNTSGCYYCHCELQYTYYTSNLGTIERMDNDLGHIKSNCVIACHHCNVSKVGSKEQSQ